MGWLDKPLATC